VPVGAPVFVGFPPLVDVRTGTMNETMPPAEKKGSGVFSGHSGSKKTPDPFFSAMKIKWIVAVGCGDG